MAHFLEADLQPWAAALIAALFAPDAAQQSTALPPRKARRLASPGVREAPAPSGSGAAAAVVSSNAARRDGAWQCLEELRPLHGAVDAVFRASRWPLIDQLPRTPAVWQPALIDSHVFHGALELSYREAAACCGAMHAVRGVHTLTLRYFPQEKEAEVGDACTAVASLSTLRTLKLGRPCPMAVSESSPVYSLLLPLTQLAALEMRWDFDRGGVTAVTPPPLCFPTTLTRLELSMWKIVHGDGCTGGLVGALTSLSRLADLRFCGPYMGGCVKAASFKAALRHLTALTTLQLCRVHLGASGAKALARRLRHLSRLAHLRLPNTDGNANGNAALAALIAHHPTALTALDLSRTYGGDAAAEALARRLRHLSQLACLRLDDNDISAAGAAALVPALSRLAALTELSLSENRLGADGAEALAPALGRLSRLATLRLAFCELRSAGVAALLAPVALLPALKHLDLSENGIGDDGMQHLAPALARLTALRLLCLAHNRADEATEAALRARLPASVRWYVTKRRHPAD